MKTIALIPARFGSTRLPGKMLKKLGEKSLIRSTYENTVNTGVFDEVIVATDDQRIADEIDKKGGQVIMTDPNHQSGTDRIAEAAKSVDADIYVNIQGDEPFLTQEALQSLVSVFEDASVRFASLMKRIKDKKSPTDPNVVKVIVDQNNDSIYFSRSMIPFDRAHEKDVPYFEHVGVYAFRGSALEEFSAWAPGPLERQELIEAIRVLERGEKIRMVEVELPGLKIDTMEELENARKYVSKM